jgi:hypothetical protein
VIRIFYVIIAGNLFVAPWVFIICICNIPEGVAPFNFVSNSGRFCFCSRWRNRFYILCFFYNYNYYPNDECKGTITSLPEGIHHIGYCAFSGSKFNANIPDSVEYIGWRAFENCQFLDITSLPESVTFIGSSAFGGCTSITRMALPVGITDIPERLFEECINLEYVTMSEDV